MEGASSSSVRRFVSICVFCGTNYGQSLEFVSAATTLGRKLTARNIRVVYGGGCLGLMGAVSLSAFLRGGQVLGVIPEPLTRKNFVGKTIGQEIQVSSMHERMKAMIENSDAFIALPGGFGTLEEIFQIVSWAQLNIHRKPIGLLNVNNFFDKLLSFVDHAVEQKFVTPSARQLLISASTVDELLDKLEAFVYEHDPVTAQIDWSGGSGKGGNNQGGSSKGGNNQGDSKKQECDLTLHL